MELEAADPLEELYARLGEPLAEFRAGGTRRLLQLLLAPLGFLLGLFFLGAPLLGLFGRKQAPFFKLMFFGLLLVAGSVASVVRWFRGRGLRVLVFPEALLSIQGERIRSLFWDEVQTVWEKRGQGGLQWFFQASLTCRLEPVEGEPLEFNSALARLDELIRVVQRQTLRSQLSVTLRKLEGGETLTFGPLTVSQDGILRRQSLLRWSEIGRFKVEGGAVSLRQEGKWIDWFSGSVTDIPNPHVLRALLEHYTHKSQEVSGTGD